MLPEGRIRYGDSNRSCEGKRLGWEKRWADKWLKYTKVKGREGSKGNRRAIVERFYV